ncbi:cytidine deaminase [candidate division WOR-3 bacterium]|nr:cytidine deaminase [candidate division WOR-3 bacterium]
MKISSETADFKRIAKELIKRTERVLKNAYAPYSNISVGAAVYCANGHIYTGCNVENSSYSLTMCAERVALFKAISEGERDFLVLLIHSSGVESILPCGACLQAYSEFAPEIVIATMNAKKEFHFFPIKVLLAKPFRLGG